MYSSRREWAGGNSSPQRLSWHWIGGWLQRWSWSRQPTWPPRHLSTGPALGLPVGLARACREERHLSAMGPSCPSTIFARMWAGQPQGGRLLGGEQEHRCSKEEGESCLSPGQESCLWACRGGSLFGRKAKSTTCLQAKSRTLDPGQLSAGRQ